MCDCFIPLGGADEVGASAYYLFLDGIHILLDCGARGKREEQYPDYNRLLRGQELQDLNELDLILISHGHYDHIGSFAAIAAQAPYAEILTTEDTRKLITLQLLGFGRISAREESERIRKERYCRAQGLLPRIQTQPVLRTFERKGCRITFLPAGHMIGAVMISLETPHHKILYTGDFSMQTLFEINQMKVPEEVKPDVLLLNMPNAYFTKDAWEKTDPRKHYEGLKRKIRNRLWEGKKVYLISRSIPKHLDLLYFLKMEFADIPVILEEKSRILADELAAMGYEVYGSKFRKEKTVPEGRCIVVGQGEEKAGYENIFFDYYSLHASPAETCRLVEQIAAGQVYLLHTFPDRRKESLIGVMQEKQSPIEIIQAENGRKYYIKGEKKMKQKQIFRNVMDAEMQKANREMEVMERKPEKFKYEWAAMYGSFQYPEMHPKEAWKKLQEGWMKRYHISYEEYAAAIKSSNLDTAERRNHMLHIVEEGVDALKKALDGDPAALERYADITENLEPTDSRNGKHFWAGKGMITFLVLLDEDLQSKSYLPIVRSFGTKYCNRLLRELRKRLFAASGKKDRRKSAKDVLKKTEEVLNKSSMESEESIARSELEQLRFQNTNYKNSLELVQTMLDELNETIDETAEEAQKTEIAAFYARMNAAEYNHLLDSMDLVERRLAEIKEKNTKVSPELLPLTIIFKQLLRFIHDCGITPIESTGRTFQASAEELASYTYDGSAYTEEGEKKNVVVERPGWKYGSSVISLPTVREI